MRPARAPGNARCCRTRGASCSSATASPTADNTSLLLDHQFVTQAAIDVVGAIDQPISADLNVKNLVGGHVGHAELGVVTLFLLIHLRAGDGDDVDGAFLRAGGAP